MATNVPFIENSDDELHCLQASYMIILKYFKPQFTIKWGEWSKVTGFEQNKGTWPIAGLIWFKKHGFIVKHIELFDIDSFSKDGEAYMRKRYPSDLAEWGIAHTNIPAEEQRARELQQYDICENHIPNIEDIKQYIDEGYLVRVHVNSRKLNSEDLNSHSNCDI